MRRRLVVLSLLLLLLAPASVVRADVALEPPPATPEAASAGEAWLPTALVGLGIGALVVLLLSLSRRGPSKKEGTP